MHAPIIKPTVWSVRAVSAAVFAAAALLVLGVLIIKPARLDAVVPVALFASLGIAFALHRAPALLDTWSGRCALALVCYLPLVDSLPARLLRLWLDVEHRGWTVIFLPESLLAISLVLAARREGAVEPRRHWPAMLCLGLLFLGGALSLIPSPDSAATFSTLWLGVVAPGFVYIGISAAPFSLSMRRTLVVALLCSTLALLVLGVVGYLLEFGPPVEVGALVANKSHLNAAGAFEQLTLGNAIHLVSFLMLILPVALLFVTLNQHAHRGEQLIALGCVALGVADLLAVVVRAAILLTLILAAILALYALRKRAQKVWVPITVIIALVLGVGWSGSSGYFTALIPHVEAAPRQQTNRPVNVAKVRPSRHVPAVEIADPSANLRIAASKRGWQVFLHHPWLGVGFGVYQVVDPVYTAPHNFVIQQAAECGVLGLLGTLCMVFVVFALRADFRVPDLKLCLWSGLVLYIVYVFPLGGNLALMNVGLWGTTFWLFAALVNSNASARQLDGEPSRSEQVWAEELRQEQFTRRRAAQKKSRTRYMLS